MSRDVVSGVKSNLLTGNSNTDAEGNIRGLGFMKTSKRQVSSRTVCVKSIA